jgi:hypothetical protein
LLRCCICLVSWTGVVSVLSVDRYGNGVHDGECGMVATDFAIDIGNARIAGLEKDLNLSSDQYEWLLTAFYITYIMFEWMALL